MEEDRRAKLEDTRAHNPVCVTFENVSKNEQKLLL